MSQAQDQYRLTAAAFGDRVQAADPDRWNAQSPCTEWSARDVVAHVVGNHRRLIAEVAGGESRPMTVDEDPKEAWASVYAAMRELTEDPEAMARPVEGPMGPMPLGQILPRSCPWTCWFTPGISPGRSEVTSGSTKRPSGRPMRRSSRWTP